jgi:hypothetical protein
MKYIFITLFLIFIIPGAAAPQSRTNLEVFYSLIDSTVSMIPDTVVNSSISVYTGSNVMLSDYIIHKLNSKFGNHEVSDKDYPFSFSLENIRVDYPDVFRKKFLGDYYVERSFLLEVNTYTSAKRVKNNYKLAFTDSVRLDDLSSLENDLHPFTKASLPSEDFADSIIEPVVAIGAAAAAVILFFVIRSK